MGVKMNLRIITKNHAADPEIGFLTKSNPKPYGRATAMPPAWTLTRRLTGFEILNNATLIFQKWLVSGIFANICHYLNFVNS